MKAQVRIIRNENLDFKRAISHLYTLAHSTHLEVKNNNRKFDELFDLLKDSLGALNLHKANSKHHPEDISSKLEVIGKLLAKNKEDPVHSGKLKDNNEGKIGTADFDGEDQKD